MGRRLGTPGKKMIQFGMQDSGATRKNWLHYQSSHLYVYLYIEQTGEDIRVLLLFVLLDTDLISAENTP